jgi:hypothetical protein
VTKGGYRATWIAAGMQPWDPKMYGQGRKRLMATGKSYKTMTYEYKTQAHHLVPTTLLGETKTLKKNLVLAAYDCDAVENGMILPEFIMDMPLHELPQHRGNHPNQYMTPIRDRLRVIEDVYDGICDSDAACDAATQLAIVKELEALSAEAAQKVLNIRTGKSYWPLTSDALRKFSAAKKEYARREKLHQQLGSA